MTDLYEKLAETHVELENLAFSVAASIRDDERDSMREDFALLERRLLDHMSWEEMYILPEYEKLLPDSAARIRAEHAKFRARLGEIGLAIDLHYVRADHFDELAKRLRAHAHHENVIYRAVAKKLPEATATVVTNRYDRMQSVARLPTMG